MGGRCPRPRSRCTLAHRSNRSTFLACRGRRWAGRHHRLDTCIGRLRCSTDWSRSSCLPRPAGKCQRCCRFRFGNLRQFHRRSQPSRRSSSCTRTHRSCSPAKWSRRSHNKSWRFRPGCPRISRLHTPSRYCRRHQPPSSSRRCSHRRPWIGDKGCWSGHRCGCCRRHWLSVSNPCMKGHRKQFQRRGSGSCPCHRRFHRCHTGWWRFRLHTRGADSCRRQRRNKCHRLFR